MMPHTTPVPSSPQVQTPAAEPENLLPCPVSDEDCEMLTNDVLGKVQCSATNVQSDSDGSDHSVERVLSDSFEEAYAKFEAEYVSPEEEEEEEEKEEEEEEEVLSQHKDKKPDLSDLVNHPEYLEWKKNLVCELCGDKGHCYSSCAVPIDVETLPIAFSFMCKCGEAADSVSKLRCRRYHGMDQRRAIKKYCLICGKWGLHWAFDCPVAREENKA